jgi:hypothetical protein
MTHEKACEVIQQFKRYLGEYMEKHELTLAGKKIHRKVAQAFVAEHPELVKEYADGFPAYSAYRLFHKF